MSSETFDDFRLSLPRSPHIPRELVPLIRKTAEAVVDQDHHLQWLDVLQIRELHRSAYGAALDVSTVEALFRTLFKRTDRIIIDRYEIYMAAMDVKDKDGEWRLKQVFSFRLNAENHAASLKYFEEPDADTNEEVRNHAMGPKQPPTEAA